MKRDSQFGVTSDPLSRYRRKLVAGATIACEPRGSHRSPAAHELKHLTLSRYVRYLTEAAVSTRHVNESH